MTAWAAEIPSQPKAEWVSIGADASTCSDHADGGSKSTAAWGRVANINRTGQAEWIKQAALAAIAETRPGNTTINTAGRGINFN